MKENSNKVRKRYTLEELLSGVTPERLKVLNDSVCWARLGDVVGREIPRREC